MDADAQRAVDALNRIGYLLERTREPTYRVKAFRRAADVVAGLAPGELAHRLADNTLRELSGIGEVTEAVVVQAAAGGTPDYLADLEAKAGELADSGQTLRAALRGDLHTHSDWSDGGSPIETMAIAARDLGHDYIALTDHSPRLTVANGLTADRLREQLRIVAELNESFA